MIQKHVRRSAAALLLVLLVLLTGCSRQPAEGSGESIEAEKTVAGFLYSFDQRAETAALVRYKNQNQFPLSVTWYYEEGGPTETSNQETSALTSTDAQEIRNIYFALSNMIIIGNSVDQTSMPCYFVTFTLPDGQECRFDFVSNSMIRLCEYNYVVESDGTLWPSLLRMNAK